MYRALILKELHDLRGVIAVAAVAVTLVTLTLAGLPLLAGFVSNNGHGQFVRFTAGAEETALTCTGFLTAVAFGYWQTFLEVQRGTALYLFHRPLSRQNIVLLKLAVGLTLQTGLMAGAIVTLGVLAGWPRMWPAPFYWSWTWGCWVLATWTLLVYLGASASGWLSARWFGLKLAPLLATGPMFLFAFLATYSAWALLGVAICSVPLIVTTLYAAESRDY